MECIYIDDASCGYQEWDMTQNATDPLDIQNKSSCEHNKELQVAQSEFQVKPTGCQSEHSVEFQDSSREFQVTYTEELQDTSNDLQIVQCNAEFQDSSAGELQDSSCELQTIDTEELQDTDSKLQILHATGLQVCNDLVFDPTPINMEDVITCIPAECANNYVVCFIPDEEKHSQVFNQNTKTFQLKNPLVTVTEPQIKKPKNSLGTVTETQIKKPKNPFDTEPQIKTPKNSLDTVSEPQIKKPKVDNRAKKPKISEVKPHQCSLCKENFKTQSRLDMHLSWCERVVEIELNQKMLKMQNNLVSTVQKTPEDESNETKNQCLKCKLEFDDKISLFKHISMHHWNELPCTHCDSIFPTGLALHEHLKLHLICYSCMVKYPNEHLYSTHIKEHESGDVYRFQCSSCNQTFRCVFQLSSHQNKFGHGEKKNWSTLVLAKKTRKCIPLEIYYTEKQLEIMGMKQCEYCWKLVKPTDIISHYQQYHHIRKCDFCNCYLSYDKHWLLQTQWHRAITEDCKYCGSKNYISGQYMFQNSIMKFMNVVSLESIKTFECRYCFVYDFGKKELLEHEKNCVRRKEEIKKVTPVIPENATKCLKCNQYKIDSKIYIHSTIYNVSALKLPCIICSKSFSCSPLIGHLFSHSYCGTCEIRFTKFFNRHFLSHKINEIHIGFCPICRYKYIDISNHMKIMHPNAKLNWLEMETQVVSTVSAATLERMVKSDENIPCVYCCKVFDTICSFELHLKFKHNIHKCPQCDSFSFDSECQAQKCQSKDEDCIVID